MTRAAKLPTMQAVDSFSVVSGAMVAGVDEVGRGCLAGPVYAAAVLFRPGREVVGLRDSKQLSAARRQALAPKIRAAALTWAIGRAEVEEIDRINILQATFLAMRRAVQALDPQPLRCRVDGSANPGLPMPVQLVVGGDALEPAIMAASILAKVARDEEMLRLDALYPGYGLAQHKGYGTPTHLAALRSLGPCALHRMSFSPCRGSGFQLPVSSCENTARAGFTGNWKLETGS